FEKADEMLAHHASSAENAYFDLLHNCPAERRRTICIKLNGFEKLPLGNEFTARVRDEDAAGSDQEWLPPRVVESWNIGRERHNGRCKSFKRTEANCRNEQHFFRFAIRLSRASHLFTQPVNVADHANECFRFRLIRNHVRSASANDRSDVEGARSEYVIYRQFNFAYPLQAVQQLE